MIFAIIVAATFLMVALTYLVYDIMVQTRNEMMITAAAKSNAVVSSLFPDHLRDRLMNSAGNKVNKTNRNLKAFLNDGKGQDQMDSKPLADLFLETTVLFADISGFTAWSSVRQPADVFTLLETVYSAFDAIAKKRRVFKVETVSALFLFCRSL